VRTRDRLPIVIKALCARSPAPRDIERLRREYEIGLPRRPLDVGWFLDIAIQLAAALAYIHRQGIVHRDIKPANILIHTRTGEVKLTNFGIAAPLAHISISTPSSSLIEGSLAYMSPEQTGRMNRGIDYRSDLYSIGVTFYEMLTGALPF
jgi:serine/threonine protein kinase